MDDGDAVGVVGVGATQPLATAVAHEVATRIPSTRTVGEEPELPCRNAIAAKPLESAVAAVTGPTVAVGSAAPGTGLT